MSIPGFKYFFSFSLSVILMLSASAQSNDSLLHHMSGKWENAKAYALKLAELMPEELYDYRPVAEVMSFREQLVHIAGNMHWLSSSYLFVKKETGSLANSNMRKTALIKYVEHAYNQAAVGHFNLNQHQLKERVPFFAGPITRQQILLLMHDHQTHHVGQLIIYLRLNGIKPVDYVGW